MKSNKVIVGILFLVLVSITGTLAIARDREVSTGTSVGHLDACDCGKVTSDTGGDRICWVEDCSPCPCVYGYAEGLFLERSNGSFDQPVLVRVQNAVPVATDLSTSDLDFDFDPALRVLVGRRLHNGWALEGSYLGLFDANSLAYVQAPSNPPEDDPISLTFPPGGLGSGTNVFANINRSWVHYTSALHSAELNLVACCGCLGNRECSKGDDGCKGDGVCEQMHHLTVERFAGFRYLRLSERFHLYAEADREPTGGGPLETESGFYDIRTGNDLYGLQFGARLRRWGPRLGWEATGKAGIFGNDASQRQSVIDWDNGPFERRSAARDGGQAAFVGELNFTGIYRLNDVWNLRAGYNLIWIAGVALAPDQLDFSGLEAAGNQLSSNGDVFLHGVSCGLEARW